MRDRSPRRSKYAHEKGVIHRDLKPANMKLTPEGIVKVLDFGLAAIRPPAAATAANDAPTRTMLGSQAGMIMGTAAYMSPEQASAKQVDKRSDIWSFGVVLWEVLTGHRLFGGETVSLTLANVLNGPIDFDGAAQGNAAAGSGTAPAMPRPGRENPAPRYRRGAGGDCEVYVG